MDDAGSKNYQYSIFYFFVEVTISFFSINEIELNECFPPKSRIMVFHTFKLNILRFNKHHYEVNNLKGTVQRVPSINHSIIGSFLISERTLDSRHSRLVICCIAK